MTETVEMQFRAVRIMHRIMFASVIVYASLAESLIKSTRSLPLSITLSFGITAIAIALVAFGYRMKMLSSATETLRRNPQDAQALFRWRQAQILIAVLLQSIGLFGFVLRFMGGSFSLAFPFYTASILLLLLLAPRQVVDAN